MDPQPETNCNLANPTSEPGNKYVNPTRRSHLDSLLAAKQITKASADWLTGALDPFHDFNYTPEGLPDQFSGSTVVQFIKGKQSITKPAGITGDWDLHIFTLPVLETNFARAYSSITPISAGLNRNLANLGTIGTLNAVAVPAGSSPFPSGNGSGFVLPTGTTFFSFSPCDNGNSYSMGRLIGGGIEAHNDTAPLYRKGSVTTYSCPTNVQYNHCNLTFTDSSYAANTSTSPIGMYKSRLPPVSVAAATQTVTSRTWSAEDGFYMPFQIDIERAGFQLASGDPLVATLVDYSQDYLAPTCGWGIDCDQSINNFYCPAGTNTTAGWYPQTTAKTVQPSRVAGLQTTGAIFAGLGPETVITLDYRFIMEIAPTPANQTLVSLASPSAKYDPIALEIYSRAVVELPPAVKVNSNAAGDWWRTVSSVLKTVAPIAANFGPYGAIASGALGGVASLGDSVLKVRAQKKAERIMAKEQEEGKAGTHSPSVDRQPAPRPKKKKPLGPKMIRRR